MIISGQGMRGLLLQKYVCACKRESVRERVLGLGVEVGARVMVRRVEVRVRIGVRRFLFFRIYFSRIYFTFESRTSGLGLGLGFAIGLG